MHILSQYPECLCMCKSLERHFEQSFVLKTKAFIQISFNDTTLANIKFLF